jgi:archaellum biogenesis ATPase FlaH
MSDDLLGAALAFVGDGLPVFPCEPRGKRPLVEGGFKAATVNTEQIRTWWTKWRLGNIGISTGAASGFVVLDIDPGGDDSLAALTRQHGSLPETRAVKTGRGRQLWFKHPGGSVRCSASVLGQGLDFRGDGGYVIAPPSIHPNGQRYAFLNNCELAELPDWLIRLTVQAKAEANPNHDADSKIPEGSRNAKLASIAGSLRRQGLSEPELCEVLRGINSRQCDPPLPEAEIAGIAASVARYKPCAAPDAPERRAKLECFAAIEPRPLRWVWCARIPAGKLSLIVGDPDKGKSLITIDIAARITTGRTFPDGAPSERGSAILLSAEDDAEDTIRPRLDAAGADVSRVHLLKAVRVVLRDGKQMERGFSLESDFDALDDAIKQTPDVRLIVIDPISAYLGAADSHNNAEVRGLLAPLAELAARTGVAILAVTHLRKSGGSAIYRAMGSLAFAAAARAVWGIAEDADDPDKRIMLRVKGNLSHDPGGLAYRIEEAPSGIPRIAWEPGAVNLRADDVLGGFDSREERSEQREAEEWLKDFLAAGPKAVSEIRRQAPQAGLAWHTVRRAADALRVKKRKSGFVSGWEWALPEDAHPCVSDMGTFEAAIENKGDTTQHSHEDAQPTSVGTFGRVSAFEEGEA